MKIFVYGSLKEGYWNNRILEGHHKVCNASVHGYALYGNSIPAATQEEDAITLGEVWDIGDNKETLSRLDRLEGHPHFYERTPIVAHGSDGNRHNCEMYVGKSFNFDTMKYSHKDGNTHSWG